uniref:Uncharacterized protein n=1 Tax=Acrobeloides nanus TaxID=290746 RepID=A0A914DKQ2_9BILA
MVFSIEGYNLGRKDPRNTLIISSDEVKQEWREFFEHDPPENMPAKHFSIPVTQKSAISQSQFSRIKLSMYMKN